MQWSMNKALLYFLKNEASPANCLAIRNEHVCICVYQCGVNLIHLYSIACPQQTYVIVTNIFYPKTHLENHQMQSSPYLMMYCRGINPNPFKAVVTLHSGILFFDFQFSIWSSIHVVLQLLFVQSIYTRPISVKIYKSIWQRQVDHLINNSNLRCHAGRLTDQLILSTVISLSSILYLHFVTQLDMLIFCFLFLFSPNHMTLRHIVQVERKLYKYNRQLGIENINLCMIIWNVYKSLACSTPQVK